MSKSPNLDYNTFQNGIADSPYVGYGRMHNLEIFQVPGVAKMKPRQKLFFTPDTLPLAMVIDKNGQLWTGTQGGRLYKNNTAATGLVGTGFQVVSFTGPIYDLKIVNDFLFIAVGGATPSISLLGPLSTGPYFWNSWKSGSMTTSYGMPMSVLTGNQTVYIGNGNNVATVTSFTPNADPSIIPTGTFNATAIPLQQSDYVQTLSVLGRNLLIGTQGGSSFVNGYAIGTANIYPYDLGTLTLGIPIPMQENGINQMFTVNNLTYVHAGIYGNVYVTNGTSIQFHKRIIFNRAFGTNMFPYPNAINYINNELLIGTSTGNDTFPSTSEHGIYSIRNGALNFKTISDYNYGTNQQLLIGAICPAGQDILYVGWQDGATYGVDTTDAIAAQNYSVFFETIVEIVAEPENDATYDDIIIYLANSLIVGQQIQLQWRDGRSNSWVPIVDNSGNSSFTTISAPANATAIYGKSRVNGVNTVQVQCAMQQLDTLPLGSNIEILGIKVLKHTIDG